MSDISIKTILVLLVILHTCRIGHSTTLYQLVYSDERFSKFYELIRNNRVARTLLNYEDVTAFIPTNEAFDFYSPDLHSSLAFYHIVYGLKGLSDLTQIKNVTTTGPKAPPLWINKLGGDIFINNAKIIPATSDKLLGNVRNQQILHVIDEVLDPTLRDLTRTSFTALDLMVDASKWRLENSPKMDSFLFKAKETHTKDIFSMPGGHTFFIPLDSGIDPHNFNLVNRYVVGAHVVPNFVLFTRSTMKKFTHESMANDELVFTVVSMEENNGKYYVRAHTVIGNSGNPKGQYIAEILVPNIPVENGVVHLIASPLGVAPRRLATLFPYLPILDKVTNDPTLSTFYDMGEATGFNSIFTVHNVSFTYFIPRDTVFWKLKQKNITLIGTHLDLLKKHLVISDMPYTMERLLSLSVNNNNAGVDLKFLGGSDKVQVLRIGDEYVLKWRDRYNIRVVRADYECTNGVIHILDGVMANVQFPREEVVDKNVDHFKNYGNAIAKMFDDIL